MPEEKLIVHPLPEKFLEPLPLFPAVLLFEVPYRSLKIMATMERPKEGTLWRKVQVGHDNGSQPSWYEILDIRKRFFQKESRVFMEIPLVADPRRVKIQYISLIEAMEETPNESDQHQRAVGDSDSKRGEDDRNPDVGDKVPGPVDPVRVGES